MSSATAARPTRPAEPVTRIRSCVLMNSLYSRAAVLPSGLLLPNRDNAMNRRDFLAASAATIAATPFARSEEKPMLSVVDTHQHLWNLDELKLAWFDPKTPEGKILGHSFTPKEYAEATKWLN